MSPILDDVLPPWEGPDLLVEAKAAALKAGQQGNVQAALPSRAERTWADYEQEETPVERPLVVAEASPVKTNAMADYWAKVRAQNAIISARVAEERGASGGTRRGTRARGSTRGAKGNSGRRGRHSILTDAQVLEIWHSTDAGVVLADRYGVSRMVISNIKTGHSWRKLTGHLGGPVRSRRKRTRITPEMYEAIVADSGTIAEIAERHGVSTASVSIARAKAKEVSTFENLIDHGTDRANEGPAFQFPSHCP